MGVMEYPAMEISQVCRKHFPVLFLILSTSSGVETRYGLEAVPVPPEKLYVAAYAVHTEKDGSSSAIVSNIDKIRIRVFMR
jgi:hypothetical protein